MTIYYSKLIKVSHKYPLHSGNSFRLIKNDGRKRYLYKKLLDRWGIVRYKIPGRKMKKHVKRLEAIMLGITMLFSMPFSGTAMAAGKTSANQMTVKTHTAQTTAAEDAESPKTTFPVHVIHKTGNDKENFVIVIMGDGYTAQQQDQFVKDATQKAQGMLTWSPYKEYSDRINIYAIQTVSNETGISEYGGKSVDTYFHLRLFGKAIGFSNGGDQKAKDLRKEMEKKYLDAGASVGTIHILSNTNGDFGASINSLFSFSMNSEDNSSGTAMTHEVSHSICGLGDEYERYTNKPNTSATSDADSIKWSKLLGFRGTGITMAGTETAFAPSRECMMRWAGQPFCEVCKMELARKLNNTDYVSCPQKLYVADPEISTPHSRTGTLDRDSEKYRISEKNITKANEKDLEFRTVVQNMVNQEQHLKMSFSIKDANGITIKFHEEKEFTIPALSNWYDPDAARESLSIVLSNVSGLVKGDILEGKVIDTDTGKVLATDKTAGQTWNTVNIHYQLKNADGTSSVIPDAATAMVYVPANTTYVLRKPDLSDYTYVGNSVNQDRITVTEAETDVTYYYQKKKDSQVTPGENPTVSPTIAPSASTVPITSPTVTPGETVPITSPIITPGETALPASPTVTPGETAPAVSPTIAPSTSTVPTTSPTVTPGETAPPASPTVTPGETAPPASPAVTPGETAPPVSPTATPGETVPTVSTKATEQSKDGQSVTILENKNTSQKKAEILVIIKSSFAKKYAKNNYSFVKRAIEKVEKETAKQRRKVVIKVRFKMQNRKNLRCRLDRATLHYLTDKKIRELQWDNGNMRLTLDLKALRTIRKQTAKEVSLTLKKIGSKKILSKIKKTNRKRFAYEFSIIDAKKKKISSIKKGKITIELGYQRSHTDKKSKMYVYQMNKNGSAVNILKSHNDVKRKKIRFWVNHPCRVVIGRKI